MLTVRKYNTVVSVVVAAVMATTITACGKGGSSKNVKIDGVIGPKVNFLDDKFMLSAVLQNVHFDGGIRIAVPHMANSYLEIGPDFQSTGMLISIGIDKNDLVKLIGNGANLLDPKTLPGGRPLPGVLEGELPGLAINVDKWADVTFYIGQAVFGVFIPVDLPLKDSMLPFRFYADNGRQIGNITVVGKDSEGKNSGFLLLINLKDRMIQTLLK